MDEFAFYRMLGHFLNESNLKKESLNSFYVKGRFKGYFDLAHSINFLTMSNSFPFYHQMDSMDCGPTCLRMVAKHYGRHYLAQTLRERAQISREGVSLFGLSEAAEKLGFRTVGVRITTKTLIDDVPLPAILHWDKNHFVVLYSIEKKQGVLERLHLKDIWGGRKALDDTAETDSDTISSPRLQAPLQSKFKQPYLFHVADPAHRHITYTRKEFEQHWLAREIEGKAEGVALLLEPTPQFYDEPEEKAPSKMDGLLSMVGYLWQYRSLVVQLMLGMLVGSGLQLLFPFLAQSVVDIGINTQNLAFIYIILFAQLALILGRSVVEFIRSWILLHISVRINLTILSDFLSKIMRLPLSFFDVKKFGDIMQRIGDHHRIESFLTGQTLMVLFSLFNLIIFGFALAFYDLTIFGVAVGASVLYTGWVLLFLKQRRQLDTKRFTVSSRNQSQIVQLIQGMQDIKLAGAEIPKRWEWERTQARLFRWNVKNLALSQYQAAGGLLINEGKNIFITFLVAKAVIDGYLTIGEMLSVQYILGQFNAPISQFVSFMQSWQDAQMSMERLNEVHEMKDEESAELFKRKEWDFGLDILLKGVNYTYPGAGNEPILRGVNLHIPYGKTTAIVGTSGSGKTTLLKLLLRFYEPQQGEIRLLNPSVCSELQSTTNNLFTSSESINLSHLSHSFWRQQCGVVMQDGFIFSDTIARNIAMSDEVIDQRKLYHAAKIANIHDFIEALALGYHTKIGTEGNGISQGQKQRILIARAVYKDPKLLLFDEATNALDSSNEAVIIKNLEDFFKGRTVVVVAHRLSTVKKADQIVVMEKGVIVECGTHEKLVALKNKYFQLISNQMELAKG
jgi:ATP-binding cassette subfamily B protein